MLHFTDNEEVNMLITVAGFILILAAVFFIYRSIFFVLKKRVMKTIGLRDDFIFDLFRIPVLWLVYGILLKVFFHFYLYKTSIYLYLLHLDSLLLIFSISWISVQSVKASAYFLQGKLDINVENNLEARKSLTQIKVFKGIIISIIIIISFSIALLTFDKARAIGISLLTSAGIIGIIVGFAAQKSIGMILAGIQLAITQPIRLDDVVIVEGEWGRIEELTLTYVVVKIWDERRLVLPVTYFLEKPFQNWTRKSSEITGTIFLYLDYSFPVESLRQAIPEMIRENPDWDGRIMNVQLTKTTEYYIEVRVLLSSSNASKNWDLRAATREKIINYINVNHPDAFSKIRLSQYKSGPGDFS
jgi:small-conductance mechanosensitive channel